MKKKTHTSVGFGFIKANHFEWLNTYGCMYVYVLVLCKSASAKRQIDMEIIFKTVKCFPH